MAYIGSPAAPTIATVSDGTVTSNKLADDAVTSAKLDTNIAVDGNLTVDTNTLYVDSTNNNVGIGTSSPDSSNKLQVSGDIGLDWATDKFIGMKFGTGGSYKMGLMLKDSSRECKVWSQSVDSDDKITFYTGSTPSERMRIDSSGRVLMNTTSSLDNNYTLHVKIASGTGGIVIKKIGSGTEVPITFYNSVGSGVGNILATESSVSYNSSSDYRLKEDVQPMSGSIDRVKALNPVNFAWKADGSRVDGFLAHEAQEVVPEAITGTKDAVDEDGNEVYQGIDQSKLVPLLTAALQEAIAKIESLEARVATLESA